MNKSLKLSALIACLLSSFAITAIAAEANLPYKAISQTKSDIAKQEEGLEKRDGKEHKDDRQENKEEKQEDRQENREDRQEDRKENREDRQEDRKKNREDDKRAKPEDDRHYDRKNK